MAAKSARAQADWGAPEGLARVRLFSHMAARVQVCSFNLREILLIGCFIAETAMPMKVEDWQAWITFAIARGKDDQRRYKGDG